MWALLVQALFNEARFSDYLEDFGNTVRKEPDFRELLGRLSMAKVLPILRELFAEPRYIERVQEENYEFLRTKEAYRKSMEIAYKRFRWTRIVL